MTDRPKCTVPGCDADADYDAPGIWCAHHWQMWWDWPEDEPEPEWFSDEWIDAVKA